MNKRNEQFTPKAVDEQVDELLQSQLATSPDAQMAHDLSQLYTENPGSLESVWHRLGLDEHMSFSDAVRQRQTNTPQERMTSQNGMTRDERNHGMLLRSHNTIPQRSFGRRFAVLAAVLVAALLVGSVFLVLNRVTHSNQSVASSNTINQSQGLLSQTPEGVYVGGRDGVARLDRYTGKTLWKYSPSKGLLAEKIIALNNTVYVSLIDYGNTITGTRSAVLAIDAQTGHLRWSHMFKGSYVEDLVTAGNMLYVDNTNVSASTIYAFNTISGTQHAAYQISSNVQTLSVANNVLYVGSSAGLSALSLSDGKQLWYNVSNEHLVICGVYIVNKVLYMAYISASGGGRANNHVAAFNTSTGEKLWQDDFQDEMNALAVINGKIFVTTVAVHQGSPYKGNLYMYDARNGKLDWDTHIDGMMQGSPIVENNLVYVSIFPGGAQPSEVAALTLANGHIQWKTKTQAIAGDVTQVVVSNGVVYVSNGNPAGYTSGSGSTVALNATTGSPLWTVPSVVEDIFTLMVAD